MKVITKYKAIDGSEHDSAESALAREELCRQVDVATAPLKPHPAGGNWDGYIQQHPAVVAKVQEALFKIANRDGVLKWWIDSQKEKHNATDASLAKVHPSWFGRVLDGSCAPLEKAYSRLCCIDEAGREWNQPFFAMNPDKGVDVCVG